MTRDELWDAYALRNPSFKGDGQITMSASGLRKLFQQTWSIAYDSGRNAGLRENALRETSKATSIFEGEIFEKFFGK
jgi:hypothetical protein